MQVTEGDFIKNPAIYLEKSGVETILITREGRTIAVLAKYSDTPVTDSLFGLFKETGIENADDLKAMRLDI